jgi:hypothetical protein
MPIKETPASLEHLTVVDIAELAKELETKWGVPPSEFVRQEKLKRLRLVRIEPQRFGMTFFLDVIVAVVFFGVTLVCYVWHVPVIGDPLALLLGPVIGLILSLKHRPPR